MYSSIWGEPTQWLWFLGSTLELWSLRIGAITACMHQFSLDEDMPCCRNNIITCGVHIYALPMMKLKNLSQNIKIFMSSNCWTY